MFKSFFLHFKTAYILEFLQLGSDGGEKRKFYHHKNNLYVFDTLLCELETWFNLEMFLFYVSCLVFFREVPQALEQAVELLWKIPKMVNIVKSDPLYLKKKHLHKKIDH